MLALKCHRPAMTAKKLRLRGLVRKVSREIIQGLDYIYRYTIQKKNKAAYKNHKYLASHLEVETRGSGAVCRDT